MNLPNCPCRSTVTGLHSTTTGSLGLIVQTSVSPVVPAANRSSQNPQVSSSRSAVIRPFQVTRLVGKWCWRREEQVPSGGVPKIWRDRRLRKWDLVASFELKSPAFWSVSGDEDCWVMTVGFQASDRYQARPVRWPESGENVGSWSRVRVGFAGQPGQTHTLSLSCILSLNFANPFRVIKSCFFFS